MANDTLNDTTKPCKAMHYDFTPDEIIALNIYFDSTCELLMLARETTKKMARCDRFDIEETKRILIIIHRINNMYNNYSYQLDRISIFANTLRTWMTEIFKSLQEDG